MGAWLSGLDRNRVFVAEGRCDELGRDLPLAAVADAVAAAVRMAGPGALDGLTSDEAATLATTVGIGHSAAAPTVTAGAESRQGQLFGAVLRALEVLAGPRPTVLVIEDLHHLDRVLDAGVAGVGDPPCTSPVDRRDAASRRSRRRR